jgi:hypothetical protein
MKANEKVVHVRQLRSILLICQFLARYMKMLVAAFLVKHYGLEPTGASQKGKRGISWKWLEQVYTKVLSKINREDI